MKKLATFLRISKSFLLNPIYITDIEKREIKTFIKLKKITVVSRRKINLVLALKI